MAPESFDKARRPGLDCFGSGARHRGGLALLASASLAQTELPLAEHLTFPAALPDLSSNRNTRMRRLASG